MYTVPGIDAYGFHTVPYNRSKTGFFVSKVRIPASLRQATATPRVGRRALMVDMWSEASLVDMWSEASLVDMWSETTLQPMY
jgi:hypothetical protein